MNHNRPRTPKRMRVDSNTAQRALAKVNKQMKKEEKAHRDRQNKEKGKS